MDVSGLADTMAPVLRLGVHGGVPVAVIEDDRICTGQVDTDTSGSGGQDEDEVPLVPVESIHQGLSHFHTGRTVQPVERTNHQVHHIKLSKKLFHTPAHTANRIPLQGSVCTCMQDLKFHVSWTYIQDTVYSPLIPCTHINARHGFLPQVLVAVVR